MTWIALPAIPPSTNNLFWNVRGRGRVMTDKYTEWRDKALAAILVARPRRVEGSYALHIQAGRPDRRKRDLDNIIKPISDALVKAGWVEDDSRCASISAAWMPGVQGVRVMVLPTTEGAP